MTIQIYDSHAREKVTFEPVTPGKVGMYVCGPTVYSDCHIGHTMGPVLFDAIARWFAVRQYDVRFVNNITDIEDKIIHKANETGEAWQNITNRYADQYFELLQALNVSTVSDHPRCTEFIPEMIAFIEDLVGKNAAYQGDDGVYFDTSYQADYGSLSGRDPKDLQGEAVAGKRNPADFALWKLAKPDEPSWESPWGAGRPGWHIECSVMSSSLLGGEFDIHGGGEELKFPHHENEIAQSHAHGDKYARLWMHNGLVQYEGAKVSKSDPRMRDPAFALQFQAKHLVEHYGGDVLRFHILRGHYRRPQEFKPEGLQATATTYHRLREQLANILGENPEVPNTWEAIQAIALPAAAAQHRDDFAARMDDDFNTGAALAQLFPLATLARKSKDAQEKQHIALVCLALARLLGCLPHLTEPVSEAQGADDSAASQALEKVMELVLALRQDARQAKDFAVADRIRDGLAAAQITVRDTADGADWSL
jgi:cysteinyl-tRNA synthetase